MHPINGSAKNSPSLSESTMQPQTVLPSTTEQPKTQSGSWKIVSNKRKGSPIKKNSSNKQTKITNYWLGPPASTSNQFDSLDETEIEPNVAHEPKPPPIFVNDVENIAPLHVLLQSIASDGYDLKVINSNNVKIMANSKVLYSAIIDALTEKQTKFHTYQLKEDRAFRVVLRHVHPTTDTEDIKKEFQLIGHSVRNIHVVIQRGTKKPLPMFYVDLEPSSNNKEVYKIELFMHSRVKIEPPRQKREIVQCTKCQRYGHTKHFCHNNARCVKCIGNHATESCKRERNDVQVQCVLCNGNHPANYKGCEIYKQLQTKHFPKLRQKISPDSKSDRYQNTNLSSAVQPTTSYAQAVTSNPRSQDEHQQPSDKDSLPQSVSSEYSKQHDMVELKLMMKKLIEQMGNMMNLLSIVVTKLAQ